MRKSIFIIVILLTCSFSSLLAQAINIKVTEETTLETLIQLLERDYNYLFSYKDDDLENIRLNLPPQKESIHSFLTSILKDTGLRFEIVQDNYIILTKEDKLSSNEQEQVLPLLCGTILDSLSQQPLAFATIYLERTKKGTTTENDGHFELRTSFNSTDSLTISYVGYQEKRFLVSDFVTSPCPTISLNYTLFEEDFIVVTDYLTTGISLKNNGAATEIRPNEIGALPGQTEPDILKTIQFLPGITSPDGSASGLCMRGGNPDQNLILWEDIPIYHSAHYFGMISAFNPYIIDKVSVYRGGFDAEFGSRISGVIDMRSDDCQFKKANFIVGSNLTNAFTSGRFSLADDRIKVLYSLRGSSLDIWQTPTFKSITRRINQGVLFEFPSSNKVPEGIRFKNDFAFIDSNIKASFQLSKRDKLTTAFLYGFNDFNSKIDDDVQKQTQRDILFLENIGTSLTWKHQWNNALSTKLLFVHSDYHYDYEYDIADQEQNMGPLTPNKDGIKKSAIKEQQIQVVTDWQSSNKHLLKIGYQLTNYDVAYQVDKRSKNQSQSNQNRTTQSLLHVVHSSFNTAKDKRFGFNVGLRQSYFEKEKSFFFEPRLRLWFRITNALNLYANAGRYFQFLSQLYEIEGDRASIDIPVWVLTGQEEVPILKSDKSQLGLIFDKKSWLVDVQTYSKKINGLTSLATAFEADLGPDYHLGDADIKGIDVLVKKRWKNYRSWVSYSISKTDYQFRTFFDRDFPSPNDQRHVFHWVNLYKWKKWEASLGWKITSGRPYSQKDFYEIVNTSNMGNDLQEAIRPIVNSFNSERLLPHHRLDASIRYTIIPKNKNRGQGLLAFSLFNAYNQSNLYDRSFLIDANNNEPAELRYSNKVDMGITPNFTFKWEW